MARKPKAAPPRPWTWSPDRERAALKKFRRNFEKTDSDFARNTRDLVHLERVNRFLITSKSNLDQIDTEHMFYIVASGIVEKPDRAADRLTYVMILLNDPDMFDANIVEGTVPALLAAVAHMRCRL